MIDQDSSSHKGKYQDLQSKSLSDIVNGDAQDPAISNQLNDTPQIIEVDPNQVNMQTESGSNDDGPQEEYGSEPVFTMSSEHQEMVYDQMLMSWDHLTEDLKVRLR